MSKKRTIEAGALEFAKQELEAVEVALERLAGLLVEGLSHSERAQMAGLRQAARRLVEIAQAVETEGLTVTGSMGQLRPHPLLAEERALRKEIADRLPNLEFRVGERARLERLRKLTRSPG